MNPTYGTALARAASAAQPGLEGSPNGASAQIQHLQNLGALQFRAGGTALATNAFGGEASSVADQEEAARRAAEAAADAEAKRQAIKDKIQEELNNPDNYVRSVSEDGGYNFYKPDGTPITVQEYSQATGKQIDKALEGSNNPKDNEFSDAYKSLMEYGRALNGDNEAVKAFKESKNGKDFLSNPENKNQTFETVVAAFQKRFGQYLQPSQLDNLTSTNSGGRNIAQDAADMGTSDFLTGNFLTNWLGRYKKENVNYR